MTIWMKCYGRMDSGLHPLIHDQYTEISRSIYKNTIPKVVFKH